MLSWRSPLADALLLATQRSVFWKSYLNQILTQRETPFSLHLGIFVEPYLQYVLDGMKTVESRFSTRRCAPYNQVYKGDVVLLKKSSGPIVGLCKVSNAWSYQLEKGSWREIRKEYALDLCAQDPKFWAERKDANFVTLMRISNVLTIDPIKFEKRDRRGWVVLQSAAQQLSLREGS